MPAAASPSFEAESEAEAEASGVLVVGWSFFLPAARRHAAFMHSERKGFRQRHYVPFVERLGKKKEGQKKGGAKETNKGG